MLKTLAVFGQVIQPVVSAHPHPAVGVLLQSPNSTSGNRVRVFCIMDKSFKSFGGRVKPGETVTIGANPQAPVLCCHQANHIIPGKGKRIVFAMSKFAKLVAVVT